MPCAAETDRFGTPLKDEITYANHARHTNPSSWSSFGPTRRLGRHKVRAFFRSQLAFFKSGSGSALAEDPRGAPIVARPKCERVL